MKKIVVLTTGGTIAMRYDPATKGLIPAMSGEDLLNAVPVLQMTAALEVIEFSNVPSGHITPAMMFALSGAVDSIALREDVDGIVITHGTDTLEETAYMLDLTLRTEKPVCVTGAMRGASETSPDGSANLLCAVQTAAFPASAGKGVLVVLNEKIYAAREVSKTHTTNPDTFASPGWGPIGHVYFDRVVINRQPIAPQKIHSERLEEDVHLIKVAAGMDEFFFQCLAAKPAKGIVVEALGCGNVPLGVKRGIELARSKNIPVVLATRVPAGRVALLYSYPGSAQSMMKSGIILAGEISGPKARLKLMLLLSETNDPAKLQEYFDQ